MTQLHRMAELMSPVRIVDVTIVIGTNKIPEVQNRNRVDGKRC